MELPTEIREAPAVNPGVLLLYSTPKAGKTTIVSHLVNSLLVELEPRGANYVDALVVEPTNPPEFNEVLDTIIKEGKKYEYLIIDTITKLDEWSEITGTYTYMNKPQGKKFNKIGNTDNTLSHTDSKFETVHELANGYGYRYSRQEMIDWYEKIASCAKYVILLAHVKDKMIESKQSGDTVQSTDISLTGKVKSIYTSRVDAVGHFYRKGKQGIINFNNENSIICGGRCKHLNNEIVISEKLEDGTIKTYWDRIYI